MHENFLRRLAAHPTLRNDHNYQVFLEFSGEVSQPLNSVVLLYCLSHVCKNVELQRNCVSRTMCGTILKCSIYVIMKIQKAHLLQPIPN